MCGNRYGFLYSIHNGEGGRAADFVDRHQGAAHAILAHDVGLRRKAVADVGHVAHVDGRAVHRLDRQIVQFRDGLRTAVHLDLIFQRPYLGGAAGGNQILRVDGINNVGGRKTVGLQPRQVEVNLDLAYLAAVGIGRGRAMYGGQLVAQKVLAQVEQHLLGNGLAAESKLHHRRGRCRVGDDQRRRGPWRQAAHRGLHDRSHLGQRRLDVGLRPEKNLDDADAGDRLRFDVLDVVDRDGNATLGVGDDAVGHVRGREPAEVPHHADHRNVDVGKNINWSAQHDDRRQDDEHQRHHNEGIGTPKREGNNPHRSGTTPIRAGSAGRLQELQKSQIRYGTYWIQYMLW